MTFVENLETGKCGENTKHHYAQVPTENAIVLEQKMIEITSATYNLILYYFLTGPGTQQNLERRLDGDDYGAMSEDFEEKDFCG